MRIRIKMVLAILTSLIVLWIGGNAYVKATDIPPGCMFNCDVVNPETTTTEPPETLPPDVPPPPGCMFNCTVVNPTTTTDLPATSAPETTVPETTMPEVTSQETSDPPTVTTSASAPAVWVLPETK